MESIINYGITIEPNGTNCNVKFSPNATLHVDIEIIIMEPKILRSGQKFSLRKNNVEYNFLKEKNIDFKTPVNTLEFKHLRNVNSLEVNNIKEQLYMPGFQINWYYSGVEVEKLYSNLAFVRNVSKIF